MSLPLIQPFLVRVGVTHDTDNGYGAFAGLAELAMRVKPVNREQEKALEYLAKKRADRESECEPVKFVTCCFELLELGELTFSKLKEKLDNGDAV